MKKDRPILRPHIIKYCLDISTKLSGTLKLCHCAGCSVPFPLLADKILTKQQTSEHLRQ